MTGPYHRFGPNDPFSSPFGAQDNDLEKRLVWKTGEDEPSGNIGPGELEIPRGPEDIGRTFQENEATEEDISEMLAQLDNPEEKMNATIDRILPELERINDIGTQFEEARQIKAYPPTELKVREVGMDPKLTDDIVQGQEILKIFETRTASALTIEDFKASKSLRELYEKQGRDKPKTGSINFDDPEYFRDEIGLIKESMKFIGERSGVEPETIERYQATVTEQAILESADIETFKEIATGISNKRRFVASAKVIQKLETHGFTTFEEFQGFFYTSSGSSTKGIDAYLKELDIYDSLTAKERKDVRAICDRPILAKLYEVATLEKEEEESARRLAAKEAEDQEEERRRQEEERRMEQRRQEQEKEREERERREAEGRRQREQEEAEAEAARLEEQLERDEAARERKAPIKEAIDRTRSYLDGIDTSSATWDSLKQWEELQGDATDELIEEFNNTDTFRELKEEYIEKTMAIYIQDLQALDKDAFITKATDEQVYREKQSSVMQTGDGPITQPAQNKFMARTVFSLALKQIGLNSEIHFYTGMGADRREAMLQDVENLFAVFGTNDPNVDVKPDTTDTEFASRFERFKTTRLGATTTTTVATGPSKTGPTLPEDPLKYRTDAVKEAGGHYESLNDLHGGARTDLRNKYYPQAAKKYELLIKLIEENYGDKIEPGKHNPNNKAQITYKKAVIGLIASYNGFSPTSTKEFESRAALAQQLSAREGIFTTEEVSSIRTIARTFNIKLQPRTKVKVIGTGRLELSQSIENTDPEILEAFQALEENINSGAEKEHGNETYIYGDENVEYLFGAHSMQASADMKTIMINGTPLSLVGMRKGGKLVPKEGLSSEEQAEITAGTTIGELLIREFTVKNRLGTYKIKVTPVIPMGSDEILRLSVTITDPEGKEEKIPVREKEMRFGGVKKKVITKKDGELIVDLGKLKDESGKTTLASAEIKPLDESGIPKDPRALPGYMSEAIELHTTQGGNLSGLIQIAEAIEERFSNLEYENALCFAEMCAIVADRVFKQTIKKPQITLSEFNSGIELALKYQKKAKTYREKAGDVTQEGVDLDFIDETIHDHLLNILVPVQVSDTNKKYELKRTAKEGLINPETKELSEAIDRAVADLNTKRKKPKFRKDNKNPDGSITVYMMPEDSLNGVEISSGTTALSLKQIDEDEQARLATLDTEQRRQEEEARRRQAEEEAESRRQAEEEARRLAEEQERLRQEEQERQAALAWAGIDGKIEAIPDTEEELAAISTEILLQWYDPTEYDIAKKQFKLPESLLNKVIATYGLTNDRETLKQAYAEKTIEPNEVMQLSAILEKSKVVEEYFQPGHRAAKQDYDPALARINDLDDPLYEKLRDAAGITEVVAEGPTEVEQLTALAIESLKKLDFSRENLIAVAEMHMTIVGDAKPRRDEEKIDAVALIQFALNKQGGEISEEKAREIFNDSSEEDFDRMTESYQQLTAQYNDIVNVNSKLLTYTKTLVKEVVENSSTWGDKSWYEFRAFAYGTLENKMQSFTETDLESLRVWFNETTGKGAIALDAEPADTVLKDKTDFLEKLPVTANGNPDPAKIAEEFTLFEIARIYSKTNRLDGDAVVAMHLDKSLTDKGTIDKKAEEITDLIILNIETPERDKSSEQIMKCMKAIKKYCEDILTRRQYRAERRTVDTIRKVRAQNPKAMELDKYLALLPDGFPEDIEAQLRAEYLEKIGGGESIEKEDTIAWIKAMFPDASAIDAALNMGNIPANPNAALHALATMDNIALSAIENISTTEAPNGLLIIRDFESAKQKLRGTPTLRTELFTTPRVAGRYAARVAELRKAEKQFVLDETYKKYYKPTERQDSYPLGRDADIAGFRDATKGRLNGEDSINIVAKEGETEEMIESIWQTQFDSAFAQLSSPAMDKIETKYAAPDKMKKAIKDLGEPVPESFNEFIGRMKLGEVGEADPAKRYFTIFEEFYSKDESPNSPAEVLEADLKKLFKEIQPIVLAEFQEGQAQTEREQAIAEAKTALAQLPQEAGDRTRQLLTMNSGTTKEELLTDLKRTLGSSITKILAYPDETGVSINPLNDANSKTYEAAIRAAVGTKVAKLTEDESKEKLRTSETLNDLITAEGLDAFLSLEKADDEPSYAESLRSEYQRLAESYAEAKLESISADIEDPKKFGWVFVSDSLTDEHTAQADGTPYQSRDELRRSWLQGKTYDPAKFAEWYLEALNIPGKYARSIRTSSQTKTPIKEAFASSEKVKSILLFDYALTSTESRVSRADTATIQKWLDTTLVPEDRDPEKTRYPKIFYPQLFLEWVNEEFLNLDLTNVLTSEDKWDKDRRNKEIGKYLKELVAEDRVKEAVREFPEGVPVEELQETTKQLFQTDALNIYANAEQLIETLEAHYKTEGKLVELDSNPNGDPDRYDRFRQVALTALAGKFDHFKTSGFEIAEDETMRTSWLNMIQTYNLRSFAPHSFEIFDTTGGRGRKHVDLRDELDKTIGDLMTEAVDTFAEKYLEEALNDISLPAVKFRRYFAVAVAGDRIKYNAKTFYRAIAEGELPAGAGKEEAQNLEYITHFLENFDFAGTERKIKVQIAPETEALDTLYFYSGIPSAVKKWEEKSEKTWEQHATEGRTQKPRKATQAFITWFREELQTGTTPLELKSIKDEAILSELDQRIMDASDGKSTVELDLLNPLNPWEFEAMPEDEFKTAVADATKEIIEGRSDPLGEKGPDFSAANPKIGLIDLLATIDSRFPKNIIPDHSEAYYIILETALDAKMPFVKKAAEEASDWADLVAEYNLVGYMPELNRIDEAERFADSWSKANPTATFNDFETALRAEGLNPHSLLILERTIKIIQSNMIAARETELQEITGKGRMATRRRAEIAGKYNLETFAKTNWEAKNEITKKYYSQFAKLAKTVAENAAVTFATDLGKKKDWDEIAPDMQIDWDATPGEESDPDAAIQDDRETTSAIVKKSEFYLSFKERQKYFDFKAQSYDADKFFEWYIKNDSNFPADFKKESRFDVLPPQKRGVINEVLNEQKDLILLDTALSIATKEEALKKPVDALKLWLDGYNPVEDRIEGKVEISVDKFLEWVIKDETNMIDTEVVEVEVELDEGVKKNIGQTLLTFWKKELDAIVGPKERAKIEVEEIAANKDYAKDWVKKEDVIKLAGGPINYFTREKVFPKFDDPDQKIDSKTEKLIDQFTSDSADYLKIDGKLRPLDFGEVEKKRISTTLRQIDYRNEILPGADELVATEKRIATALTKALIAKITVGGTLQTQSFKDEKEALEVQLGLAPHTKKHADLPIIKSPVGQRAGQDEFFRELIDRFINPKTYGITMKGIDSHLLPFSKTGAGAEGKEILVADLEALLTRLENEYGYKSSDKDIGGIRDAVEDRPYLEARFEAAFREQQKEGRRDINNSEDQEFFEHGLTALTEKVAKGENIEEDLRKLTGSFSETLQEALEAEAMKYILVNTMEVLAVENPEALKTMADPAIDEKASFFRYLEYVGERTGLLIRNDDEINDVRLKAIFQSLLVITRSDDPEVPDERYDGRKNLYERFYDFSNNNLSYGEDREFRLWLDDSPGKLNPDEFLAEFKLLLKESTTSKEIKEHFERLEAFKNYLTSNVYANEISLTENLDGTLKTDSEGEDIWSLIRRLEANLIIEGQEEFLNLSPEEKLTQMVPMYEAAFMKHGSAEVDILEKLEKAQYDKLMGIRADREITYPQLSMIADIAGVILSPKEKGSKEIVIKENTDYIDLTKNPEEKDDMDTMEVIANNIRHYIDLRSNRRPSEGELRTERDLIEEIQYIYTKDVDKFDYPAVITRVLKAGKESKKWTSIKISEDIFLHNVIGNYPEQMDDIITMYMAGDDHNGYFYKYMQRQRYNRNPEALKSLKVEDLAKNLKEASGMPIRYLKKHFGLAAALEEYQEAALSPNDWLDLVVERRQTELEGLESELLKSKKDILEKKLKELEELEREKIGLEEQKEELEEDGGTYIEYDEGGDDPNADRRDTPIRIALDSEDGLAQDVDIDTVGDPVEELDNQIDVIEAQISELEWAIEFFHSLDGEIEGIEDEGVKTFIQKKLETLTEENFIQTMHDIDLIWSTIRNTEPELPGEAETIEISEEIDGSIPPRRQKWYDEILEFRNRDAADPTLEAEVVEAAQTLTRDLEQSSKKDNDIDVGEDLENHLAILEDESALRTAALMSQLLTTGNLDSDSEEIPTMAESEFDTLLMSVFSDENAFRTFSTAKRLTLESLADTWQAELNTERRKEIFQTLKKEFFRSIDSTFLAIAERSKTPEEYRTVMSYLVEKGDKNFQLQERYRYLFYELTKYAIPKETSETDKTGHELTEKEAFIDEKRAGLARDLSYQGALLEQEFRASTLNKGGKDNLKDSKVDFSNFQHLSKNVFTEKFRYAVRGGDFLTGREAERVYGSALGMLEASKAGRHDIIGFGDLALYSFYAKEKPKWYDPLALQKPKTALHAKEKFFTEFEELETLVKLQKTHKGDFEDGNYENEDWYKKDYLPAATSAALRVTDGQGPVYKALMEELKAGGMPHVLDVKHLRMEQFIVDSAKVIRVLERINQDIAIENLAANAEDYGKVETIVTYIETIYADDFADGSYETKDWYNKEYLPMIEVATRELKLTDEMVESLKKGELTEEIKELITEYNELPRSFKEIYEKIGYNKLSPKDREKVSPAELINLYELLLTQSKIYSTYSAKIHSNEGEKLIHEEWVAEWVEESYKPTMLEAVGLLNLDLTENEWESLKDPSSITVPQSLREMLDAYRSARPEILEAAHKDWTFKERKHAKKYDRIHESIISNKELLDPATHKDLRLHEGFMEAAETNPEYEFDDLRNAAGPYSEHDIAFNHPLTERLPQIDSFEAIYISDQFVKTFIEEFKMLDGIKPARKRALVEKFRKNPEDIAKLFYAANGIDALHRNPWDTFKINFEKDAAGEPTGRKWLVLDPIQFNIHQFVEHNADLLGSVEFKKPKPKEIFENPEGEGLIGIVSRIEEFEHVVFDQQEFALDRIQGGGDKLHSFMEYALRMHEMGRDEKGTDRPNRSELQAGETEKYRDPFEAFSNRDSAWDQYLGRTFDSEGNKENIDALRTEYADRMLRQGMSAMRILSVYPDSWDPRFEKMIDGDTISDFYESIQVLLGEEAVETLGLEEGGVLRGIEKLQDSEISFFGAENSQRLAELSERQIGALATVVQLGKVYEKVLIHGIERKEAVFQAFALHKYSEGDLTVDLPEILRAQDRMFAAQGIVLTPEELYSIGESLVKRIETNGIPTLVQSAEAYQTGSEYMDFRTLLAFPPNGITKRRYEEMEVFIDRISRDTKDSSEIDYITMTNALTDFPDLLADDEEFMAWKMKVLSDFDDQEVQDAIAPYASDELKENFGEYLDAYIKIRRWDRQVTDSYTERVERLFGDLAGEELAKNMPMYLKKYEEIQGKKEVQNELPYIAEYVYLRDSFESAKKGLPRGIMKLQMKALEKKEGFDMSNVDLYDSLQTKIDLLYKEGDELPDGKYPIEKLEEILVLNFGGILTRALYDMEEEASMNLFVGLGIDVNISAKRAALGINVGTELSPTDRLDLLVVLSPGNQFRISGGAMKTFEDLGKEDQGTLELFIHAGGDFLRGGFVGSAGFDHRTQVKDNLEVGGGAFISAEASEASVKLMAGGSFGIHTLSPESLEEKYAEQLEEARKGPLKTELRRLDDYFKKHPDFRELRPTELKPIRDGIEKAMEEILLMAIIDAEAGGAAMPKNIPIFKGIEFGGSAGVGFDPKAPFKSPLYLNAFIGVRLSVDGRIVMRRLVDPEHIMDEASDTAIMETMKDEKIVAGEMNLGAPISIEGLNVFSAARAREILRSWSRIEGQAKFYEAGSGSDKTRNPEGEIELELKNHYEMTVGIESKEKFMKKQRERFSGYLADYNRDISPAEVRFDQLESEDSYRARMTLSNTQGHTEIHIDPQAEDLVSVDPETGDLIFDFFSGFPIITKEVFEYESSHYGANTLNVYTIRFNRHLTRREIESTEKGYYYIAHNSDKVKSRAVRLKPYRAIERDLTMIEKAESKGSEAFSEQYEDLDSWLDHINSARSSFTDRYEGGEIINPTHSELSNRRMDQLKGDLESFMPDEFGQFETRDPEKRRKLMDRRQQIETFFTISALSGVDKHNKRTLLDSGDSDMLDVYREAEILIDMIQTWYTEEGKARLTNEELQYFLGEMIFRTFFNIHRGKYETSGYKPPQGSEVIRENPYFVTPGEIFDDPDGNREDPKKTPSRKHRIYVTMGRYLAHLKGHAADMARGIATNYVNNHPDSRDKEARITAMTDDLIDQIYGYIPQQIAEKLGKTPEEAEELAEYLLYRNLEDRMTDKSRDYYIKALGFEKFHGNSEDAKQKRKDMDEIFAKPGTLKAIYEVYESVFGPSNQAEAQYLENLNPAFASARGFTVEGKYNDKIDGKHWYMAGGRAVEAISTQFGGLRRAEIYKLNEPRRPGETAEDYQERQERAEAILEYMAPLAPIGSEGAEYFPQSEADRFYFFEGDENIEDRIEHSQTERQERDGAIKTSKEKYDAITMTYTDVKEYLSAPLGLMILEWAALYLPQGQAETMYDLFDTVRDKEEFKRLEKAGAVLNQDEKEAFAEFVNLNQLFREIAKFRMDGDKNAFDMVGLNESEYEVQIRYVPIDNINNGIDKLTDNLTGIRLDTPLSELQDNARDFLSTQLDRDNAEIDTILTKFTNPTELALEIYRQALTQMTGLSSQKIKTILASTTDPAELLENVQNVIQEENRTDYMNKTRAIVDGREQDVIPMAFIFSHKNPDNVSLVNVSELVALITFGKCGNWSTGYKAALTNFTLDQTSSTYGKGPKGVKRISTGAPKPKIETSSGELPIGFNIGGAIRREDPEPIDNTGDKVSPTSSTDTDVPDNQQEGEDGYIDPVTGEFVPWDTTTGVPPIDEAEPTYHAEDFTIGSGTGTYGSKEKPKGIGRKKKKKKRKKKDDEKP